MKITKPVVAIFRKITKLRTFTIGAILALTFGIIANANADHILWASTGGTNANGGGRIYTINPVTLSVTLIGDTALDRLDALAFDNNGILYGISGGPSHGLGLGNLWTISTTDAFATFVGTATATDLTGFGSIAFDSSGTLFGGGFFDGRLLTLNPATAAVITDIPMIGSGNAFAAGLAFDSTGQLFGSRGNSGGHLEDLVSINTTTGMQTAIGGITDTISDIAFTRDGTLYASSPVAGAGPGGGGGGTGGGTADSELFTIDPTTGVKTSLIANTGIRISGLTTHDNPIATSGTPVMGPNGNFYEVVASPGISWDAAHTAATNLTFDGVVGHLATITSAEEDAFVDGLRVAALGAGSASAWIGGSQPDGETTPQDGWAWVNGEGSIPGVDSSTPYADWNVNEPNDFPGIGFEDNEENHLAIGFYGLAGGWNDENGAATNPYIVEYDFASQFVPPSNVPKSFLRGSLDPKSPHGVSGGFQQVLQGGNVTFACCRVLYIPPTEGDDDGDSDDDNGSGTFDLGLAIADPMNPTCVDMPAVAEGTALLRSWQRPTLRSRGIPNDTEGQADPDGVLYRENELGVCVMLAEPVSKGVMFTEEEAFNVLGYSVNCAEIPLNHRPFTGGLTFNEEDAELDAPFATPWTAECNQSRSGKRRSDTIWSPNLRAVIGDDDDDSDGDSDRRARLLGLANVLLKSIKQDICIDSVFKDNLKRDVRRIRGAIRRGRGNRAGSRIDDATRRALVIDPFELGGFDPYNPTGALECPGNPKGLFVGRLMALGHQSCSVLVQSGPGEDASVPNCEIAGDILNEMPELPE